MKKIIAVILSVLILFSASSVLASAEGEPEAATYTITFVNYDGEVISTLILEEGAAVTVPANPSRPADGERAYIFSGWRSSVANYTYNPANVPAATCDVTYTASFLNDDIEPDDGNISLFNLFENLFSQLNVIFEQVALFFEGLARTFGNLFGDRTIGGVIGQ